MLTTVTTIAGLLPLATGYSIDMVNRKIEVGGMVASWWQPLASAIVNGLLVATIMTLLLTPAMLLLPEILRQKLCAKSLKAAPMRFLTALQKVVRR
jgi:multidrug efflux pump